jgi:FixJ family two-component response regulator
MPEAEEKSMQEQIRATLEELSREEQLLLSRVVAKEREKLHMGKPRGIQEDIWQAVKEVIK